MPQRSDRSPIVPAEGEYARLARDRAPATQYLRAPGFVTGAKHLHQLFFGRVIRGPGSVEVPAVLRAQSRQHAQLM